MDTDHLARLVPVLPEIVLGTGAAALLMLGVFQTGRPGRMVDYAAIALLAVAGIVLLLLPAGKLTGFGGSFIVDDFARFLKILALLGSAAAIAMSLDYAEHAHQQRFEYSVLILLSTLGMMMLISAADLICDLSRPRTDEPAAFSLVAAGSRDSLRSTEAGLKYFVLGALSSGMLLHGASLTYGFTGTLAFCGLRMRQGRAAPKAGGISLIFDIDEEEIFLFAGFCFGVSAVPFHMWTPDVYEGAPTPMAAFFATAPKWRASAPCSYASR